MLTSETANSEASQQRARAKRESLQLHRVDGKWLEPGVQPIRILLGAHYGISNLLAQG